MKTPVVNAACKLFNDGEISCEDFLTFLKVAEIPQSLLLLIGAWLAFASEKEKELPSTRGGSLRDPAMF